MGDRLKAQLNKFKYPLLALVLGLIIMLLPIGGSSSQSVARRQTSSALRRFCKGATVSAM